MADGTAYSPADKAGKNGGTSGQQLRTLAEIREAIAENDGLRLGPDTTDEERRALEEAALALRAVERELVEATSDTLMDRLGAASEPIEDLARDIRARVTSMNAPAKFLGHLKKAASLLTRFLTEAGRW